MRGAVPVPWPGGAGRAHKLTSAGKTQVGHLPQGRRPGGRLRLCSDSGVPPLPPGSLCVRLGKAFACDEGRLLRGPATVSRRLGS